MRMILPASTRPLVRTIYQHVVLRHLAVGAPRDDGRDPARHPPVLLLPALASRCRVPWETTTCRRRQQTQKVPTHLRRVRPIIACPLAGFWRSHHRITRFIATAVLVTTKRAETDGLDESPARAPSVV